MAVPDVTLDRCVFVFHGIGDNPNTMKHLINHLKDKNLICIALPLPAHTTSNSKEFELTTKKINDYITYLTDKINHIPIKKTFIGISFGASFARIFSEKFNSHLILISPYIEPKRLDGFIILKTLTYLDIIKPFPLGSLLSYFFPRFSVGSSTKQDVGLKTLPGSSLYFAYKLINTFRYTPLKVPTLDLLLAKDDKVICNNAALKTYSPYANSIRNFNGKHNLLNKQENSPEVYSDMLAHISTCITSNDDLQPITLNYFNSTVPRLFSYNSRLTQKLLFPHPYFLRLFNHNVTKVFK